MGQKNAGSCPARSGRRAMKGKQGWPGRTKLDTQAGNPTKYHFSAKERQ